MILLTDRCHEENFQKDACPFIDRNIYSIVLRMYGSEAGRDQSYRDRTELTDIYP